MGHCPKHWHRNSSAACSQQETSTFPFIYCHIQSRNNNGYCAYPQPPMKAVGAASAQPPLGPKGQESGPCAFHNFVTLEFTPCCRISAYGRDFQWHKWVLSAWFPLTFNGSWVPTFFLCLWKCPLMVIALMVVEVTLKCEQISNWCHVACLSLQTSWNNISEQCNLSYSSRPGGL